MTCSNASYGPFIRVLITFVARLIYVCRHVSFVSCDLTHTRNSRADLWMSSMGNAVSQAMEEARLKEHIDKGVSDLKDHFDIQMQEMKELLDKIVGQGGCLSPPPITPLPPVKDRRFSSRQRKEEQRSGEDWGGGGDMKLDMVNGHGHEHEDEHTNGAALTGHDDEGLQHAKMEAEMSSPEKRGGRRDRRRNRGVAGESAPG